MNIPKYTPDPIPNNVEWWTENDIFVFGSNNLGIHGAGAAKAARDYYGAIYGQAHGIQGNSYAIVTISFVKDVVVTLEDISKELDIFISYCKNNTDKQFWMTKIGTGLSYFTIEEMKELFLSKKFPINVKLSKEFTNENK